ncbi:MAG: hypothetical protein CM15mP85_30270 [Rhodobacterales bacterium]|nr:MAG: hypothetical protein CM15mP85_30270 [Rhodobacterales bacterium]
MDQNVYWSTALGLAELALSGCTTSSDHLYIYPNGARLDDSLSAAAELALVSWNERINEIGDRKVGYRLIV